MKRRFFLFTLLITGIGIFLSSCVSLQVSPVSGNKRIYGYSWEQELNIGKEADGEIIAQYGLYEDDELAEYVNNLGQTLLEVSHFNREDTPEQYRNTPFTFRVLNSPVVNAFALPGGYVYVTRGLLAHLNNEAQLMVVLGHEIGHVAARHASQRAAEQQLGQVAIIGGAVVGQSFGLDGGQIMELSGTTAQLLFLRYSRDDERESDRLGVEYTAMKGYEAAEGGQFFTSLKRISDKAGYNIPSHLSSHPDPGEREQNIPRMAATWEQEGYEQSLVNRDEFLKKIDGLLYGDNPREGFVDGSTFYHPDLEFEFSIPDGFTVMNQSSAVILYNQEQDAITQFTIDSENTSPQTSVYAFTGQDGITIVEEGALKVNGFDAYQAQALANTEDGTELSMLITTVDFNGRLFRFLSYTSAAQYASYADDFAFTATSLNVLDDPEILGIQPVRLKLQRVQQTSVFSELLPNPLPMKIDPEDVAILNQVQLTDTIQRGTLIKIPVQ